MDLTIPVSLLTIDEAIKKVSKFDKLSQLRILLMIQSVAIMDNQYHQQERKMILSVANQLGINSELPQESIEKVIGLLYKFASIDGNIPEEEKALLINLLGSDGTAYNNIVEKAGSFNVNEAVEVIAAMKEIDKSLVGFYIQQIISADEKIEEEESSLIKNVFESTGIDALCIPEKTGFWKRIFG